MQSKIRQGKLKKQYEEKNVEADMEIATLNKQKTVVRVG